MTENKRYIRFIDNYEDVYIKTPTKQKIEIGWEDDVFVDSIDEVVGLLNEQDERIKGLENELKNRKKLNNILEGFLLDKGYDFNDILKFLQDRTEKGRGK